MSVNRVRSVARRVAPPAAALFAVLLACLVPGCGSVSGTSATSVGPRTSEVSPTITDAVVDTTRPGGPEQRSEGSTNGTGAEAGGLSVEDWVVPSPDVIVAFAHEAARVDLPLYVPARLPPGSTVREGGVGAAGLSEGGAQSVVRLATDLGSVEIAQGIEGDVGDLPGESCGDVAGRPAAVYRISDGYLVQWSDPPWWYGVFSDGMSKEAVVALARAMVRYEHSDE